MNFGAPSPQTGTITSWSFHYSCVPPRTNPYHATLMMYRLNSATSQYQVLSESIQSITVECADTGVTLRGNRMLMAEEQFRVEKGDILAVCLPNDDMEPLRIASTRLFSINRDRESSDIGEFSISRGEGCSTDRLQLQTINLQDLDLRQNFQLHLYAEAITGIICNILKSCPGNIIVKCFLQILRQCRLQLRICQILLMQRLLLDLLYKHCQIQMYHVFCPLQPPMLSTS